MKKRRFFATAFEPHAPFWIESIGFNPDQEPIRRPTGYGWYHWLQTKDGEGEAIIGERVYRLLPTSGLMLLPHTPHRYYAVGGGRWSTFYLTFGGPLAAQATAVLGIDADRVYRWDAGCPLDRAVPDAALRLTSRRRLSGLDLSVEVYRFLVALKRYGRPDGVAVSIDRLEQRIAPLLAWLDRHFANPDVGVADMADVLGVSPRHLRELFKRVYGCSPYRYLLGQRLRRAKERLLSYPDEPVRTVAERVGFRDAGHFIAAFRKAENMTPEQFRKLHLRR